MNSTENRLRLLELKVTKLEQLFGSKLSSPPLLEAIRKFIAGDPVPLQQIYGKHSIVKSQEKNTKRTKP